MSIDTRLSKLYYSVHPTEGLRFGGHLSFFRLERVVSTVRRFLLELIQSIENGFQAYEDPCFDYSVNHGCILDGG
jgi:hypothetical protein